jgi:hypothetical protein
MKVSSKKDVKGVVKPGEQLQHCRGDLSMCRGNTLLERLAWNLHPEYLFSYSKQSFLEHVSSAS